MAVQANAKVIDHVGGATNGGGGKKVNFITFYHSLVDLV